MSLILRETSFDSEFLLIVARSFYQIFIHYPSIFLHFDDQSQWILALRFSLSYKNHHWWEHGSICQYSQNTSKSFLVVHIGTDCAPQQSIIRAPTISKKMGVSSMLAIQLSSKLLFFCNEQMEWTEFFMQIFREFLRNFCMPAEK